MEEDGRHQRRTMAQATRQDGAVELPDDVLLAILHRVVSFASLERVSDWRQIAKDLSSCASVCRTWRSAVARDRPLFRHVCVLQAGQGCRSYRYACQKLEKELCGDVWNCNDFDWRAECARRASWANRLQQIVEEEIMWPKQRSGCLSELASERHLSESFALEMRSRLQQSESEIYRLGDLHWSEEILWHLRAAHAEDEMRKACEASDASDRDEGSHGHSDLDLLCIEERNVEAGALAIASVFNRDVDELGIPEYLDALGEELSRRLAMLERVGGETESRDCRARQGSAGLSAADQIKAVNSLLFNPPASTEERPVGDPLTHSLSFSHPGIVPAGTLLAIAKGLDEVPRADAGCSSNLNVKAWPGLGLRGNRTDYYSPRNSRIDIVLSGANRGIPITLAIIYTAVARRAGLPVRMINAPGHFLVALDDLFVDVFGK